MTKIVEFSTFRPTRPAGRLGLAARLSAAEPTLVASCSGPLVALRASQIAISGPPARDLGATSSQTRDPWYW